MSAGVGEADLCLVRNISRRLLCPRQCLSGVSHERHHRRSPQARMLVLVLVLTLDESELPSAWEWSSRAARVQEREQVPVGVRRLEPVQVRMQVRFELPVLGLGQH